MPSSSLGTAIAVGIGAGAASITAISIPFLSPALRKVCIPYVPASPPQIDNVTALIRRCEQLRGPVVDLGSGDGRIVLKCAQLGLPSVGIELNYPLVLYSRLAAVRLGLASSTRFRRRDIFKTDLNEFKTAILFGSESMMGSMVPKLAELLPGSHLILCRFSLPDACPGWELADCEGAGIDEAWLYRRLNTDVNVNDDLVE